MEIGEIAIASHLVSTPQDFAILIRLTIFFLIQIAGYSQWSPCLRFVAENCVEVGHWFYKFRGIVIVIAFNMMMFLIVLLAYNAVCNHADILNYIYFILFHNLCSPFDSAGLRHPRHFWTVKL